MGELIRVFHDVTMGEAQSLVDSLAQRRIPLIWEGHDTRRVLQQNLKMQSQILLLLATSRSPVRTSDLLQWIEYRNVGYFRTSASKVTPSDSSYNPCQEAHEVFHISSSPGFAILVCSTPISLYRDLQVETSKRKVRNSVLSGRTDMSATKSTLWRILPSLPRIPTSRYPTKTRPSTFESLWRSNPA